MGREQWQEPGRIILKVVGRAKRKMSNRQVVLDLGNTEAGFLGH